MDKKLFIMYDNYFSLIEDLKQLQEAVAKFTDNEPAVMTLTREIISIAGLAQENWKKLEAFGITSKDFAYLEYVKEVERREENQ